ncbi:NUDIX hydrolase [soil metagenome]
MATAAAYACPVDDDLRETTLGSRVIHRGRYLSFRVDTIADAAGERREREVVEHPGAVVIVALLGQDVLMVRQWRTPVGGVLLELPAGTLDRLASGATEDPDVAAARELAEETGYAAGRWRSLARFYTAPGFTDELMHLYLATDLRAIPDHPGPAPDEHLRVERLPWRTAVSMAESGELRDAKSLVGLLRLARLSEQGDLT